MNPADGDNPYESPCSVVDDRAGETVVLMPATKLRRFVHWMIDRIIVVGIIFLAMIVAGIVGGDEVLDWAERMTWWQDQLIGAAVMIVYYTLMESTTGTTIGKLLARTRVVDESGRRISFNQALLRSLSRVVPFEAFSILFADDEDPRGWHDRWPRTRVVLRRRPAALSA
ncbi:MAG: RDD family protein [Pseudoxanthomonas mexicana]|nr:RDD family protein [Pseudoxanthomonas mexicana]